MMQQVKHAEAINAKRGGEEYEEEEEEGSADEGPSRKGGKHGNMDMPISGKRKAMGKGKKKDKELDKVRTIRKFIAIRVCSLPSKTQLAKDPGTNGDAVLNLMLFEAETEETVRGGGDKTKKVYKGGSGGAFEKWQKLAVGAVVGIINPKIMKPYGVSLSSIPFRNILLILYGKSQDSKANPHPLEHPVGLSVSSVDDIFLIGRAKDIGTCVALKKDGNQCTSWVDV